jgi:leader peptidase (prepilin peptidase)/N-methyltransferase
MQDILLISFFALGAIVASFVGVVSARLYTGQSFAKGRSRCDSCGKALSVGQLVPIISYAFSRGRASCCGAKLSIVSPLSEIVLGALFVLAYLMFGMTGELLLVLLSLALLLALVLYDLAHQILPPALLAPFVALSAASGFARASSLSEWGSTVLLALVLALILAALHYGSRGRAMGLADTPFVFGLALLVGPVAFTGFVFSFWIGAVIGIVLLLRRPRGSRMGVEVPFAPFLAAGFLLALFTQWNIFTLIANVSGQ